MIRENWLPKPNSGLDLALRLPPSHDVVVKHARDVHLHRNNLISNHVQVLFTDIAPQTRVLQRQLENRYGLRGASRSERPQNRKRNHPRPSLPETTHIKEVKAPLPFKTRRSCLVVGVLDHDVRAEPEAHGPVGRDLRSAVEHLGQRVVGAEVLLAFVFFFDVSHEL